MGITEGTLLEVSVQGGVYSQAFLNVWQYEVTGTFSGISAGAVGHAWWDEVKANYRGLVTTPYTEAFTVVRVRELNNPTGEYGEYAVPLGEQAGTRNAEGAYVTAPFIAMGCRLTVGTRVTRPGQKRFWGFTEADTNGSGWSAAALSAAATLAAQMTASMTLASPALGMDLQPIVCRKDKATGEVLAHQNVTGYLLSNLVTTQNTRKVGRGM